MANEFKIKNGFFSEGSSNITGSLNVSAGITGSLFGTASYATQALSASWAPGGTGTVTSVATAGTVNGITLTGGTITTSGTITLGGTLSNVQSSQLATSSLMIGSTNIALGATASTLAGLTSITATNFTGTASYATQATSAYTASYVQNAVSASYVLNAVSASYATQALSASYATQALSSSYAVTASYALTAGSTTAVAGTTNYVPKFATATTLGNSQIFDNGTNVGIGTITPNSKLQIVGNTSISGSLITSGSSGDGINTSTLELLASGVASIDWGNKELYDTNNTVTVDWEQMILSSPQGGGVTTVYWGANLLKSLNTSMSIDWDTRLAYDSAGTSSIDWGTRALNDSFAFTSLDWENKALYDSTGVGSMDWNTRMAVDSNVSRSLDYQNRNLYDPLEIVSLDWSNRTLYDNTSVTSVEWGSRALLDSAGAGSIDWENRFLFSATLGIKALSWDSDYWLYSPSYQKDEKSITLQDVVSDLGASDDTYLGDIIEGRVDGINYPSNGQVVYLETDGFWYAYDQGDTNIYGKMIGLVFNVDTGGQTCKVLLEGHVLIDNIIGPEVQGVDYGLPVYIKYLTTTGEMDTGSPSDGIVQVLGHCYYKNTTTSDYWMMKFRPSVDWYKAT